MRSPWPLVSILFIFCLLGLSGSNSQCEIRDIAGQIRPHKVLVFVDASYLKLFQNWLIYYDAICGDGMTKNYTNLELVCMDASLADDLSAVGLHCSAAHHSSIVHHQDVDSRYTHALKMSNVWMKRLEIMLTILRDGGDLILSDTDAFWLRNPYFQINKHSTSSIVSSRGWFPQALSKRWGSTLCMGFIYARSDVFTVTLFERVLEHMQDTHRAQIAFYQWSVWNESTAHASTALVNSSVFNLTAWHQRDSQAVDDQFSVNSRLQVMNITWPANMSRNLQHTAHVGEVWVNGSAYTITLLPENDFLRNCAGLSTKKMEKMIIPTSAMLKTMRGRLANATIAHCLTPPGNSTRKENFLVLYSLWKLPHNVTLAHESINEDILELRRANHVKFLRRRSEILANQAKSNRTKAMSNWRMRNSTGTRTKRSSAQSSKAFAWRKRTTKPTSDS